jgi:hypothetical protein
MNKIALRMFAICAVVSVSYQTQAYKTVQVIPLTNEEVDMEVKIGELEEEVELIVKLRAAVGPQDSNFGVEVEFSVLPDSDAEVKKRIAAIDGPCAVAVIEFLHEDLDLQFTQDHANTITAALKTGTAGKVTIPHSKEKVLKLISEKAQSAIRINMEELQDLIEGKAPMIINGENTGTIKVCVGTHPITQLKVKAVEFDIKAGERDKLELEDLMRMVASADENLAIPAEYYDEILWALHNNVAFKRDIFISSTDIVSDGDEETDNLQVDRYNWVKNDFPVSNGLKATVWARHIVESAKGITGWEFEVLFSGTKSKPLETAELGKLVHQASKNIHIENKHLDDIVKAVNGMEAKGSITVKMEFLVLPPVVEMVKRRKMEKKAEAEISDSKSTNSIIQSYTTKEELITDSIVDSGMTKLDENIVDDDAIQSIQVDASIKLMCTPLTKEVHLQNGRDLEITVECHPSAKTDGILHRKIIIDSKDRTKRELSMDQTEIREMLVGIVGPNFPYDLVVNYVGLLETREGEMKFELLSKGNEYIKHSCRIEDISSSEVLVRGTEWLSKAQLTVVYASFPESLKKDGHDSFYIRVEQLESSSGEAVYELGQSIDVDFVRKEIEVRSESRNQENSVEASLSIQNFQDNEEIVEEQDFTDEEIEINESDKGSGSNLETEIVVSESQNNIQTSTNGGGKSHLQGSTTTSSRQAIEKKIEVRFDEGQVFIDDFMPMEWEEFVTWKAERSSEWTAEEKTEFNKIKESDFAVEHERYIAGQQMSSAEFEVWWKNNENELYHEEITIKKGGSVTVTVYFYYDKQKFTKADWEKTAAKKYNFVIASSGTWEKEAIAKEISKSGIKMDATIVNGFIFVNGQKYTKVQFEKWLTENTSKFNEEELKYWKGIPLDEITATQMIYEIDGQSFDEEEFKEYTATRTDSIITFKLSGSVSYWYQGKIYKQTEFDALLQKDKTITKTTQNTFISNKSPSIDVKGGDIMFEGKARTWEQFEDYRQQHYYWLSSHYSEFSTMTEDEFFFMYVTKTEYITYEVKGNGFTEKFTEKLSVTGGKAWFMGQQMTVAEIQKTLLEKAKAGYYYSGFGFVKLVIHKYEVNNGEVKCDNVVVTTYTEFMKWVYKIRSEVAYSQFMQYLMVTESEFLHWRRAYRIDGKLMTKEEYQYYLQSSVKNYSKNSASSFWVYKLDGVTYTLSEFDRLIINHDLFIFFKMQSGHYLLTVDELEFDGSTVWMGSFNIFKREILALFKFYDENYPGFFAKHADYAQLRYRVESYYTSRSYGMYSGKSVVYTPPPVYKSSTNFFPSYGYYDGNSYLSSYKQSSTSYYGYSASKQTSYTTGGVTSSYYRLRTVI